LLEFDGSVNSCSFMTRAHGLMGISLLLLNTGIIIFGEQPKLGGTDLEVPASTSYQWVLTANPAAKFLSTSFSQQRQELSLFLVAEY